MDTSEKKGGRREIWLKLVLIIGTGDQSTAVLLEIYLAYTS